MGNLIPCPCCKTPIDPSSNFCTKCGCKIAKEIPPVNPAPQQKKKSGNSWIAIVLISLGAVLMFNNVMNIIFSVGDAEKVGSTNSENVAVSNNASQKDVFTVGDIVDLGGVVVTLLDITETSGNGYVIPSEGNVFIICEFEIENKSGSDIGISSAICFDAYADDYSATISLSALMCGNKQQLDGAIAQGKKMRGIVGYEVPANWREFEIRFTPNFLSSKEIVFIYTK